MLQNKTNIKIVGKVINVFYNEKMNKYITWIEINRNKIIALYLNVKLIIGNIYTLTNY